MNWKKNFDEAFNRYRLGKASNCRFQLTLVVQSLRRHAKLCTMGLGLVDLSVICHESLYGKTGNEKFLMTSRVPRQ